MVHARKLDGKAPRFGHSGWLWHNAFLLYDEETGSLWHHQTGVAVSGPLRGRALSRFPGTALMTFGAWRREHPGTLVLAKPADPAAPVETDPYAARTRILPVGLAIDLPGVALLWPLDQLPDLEAVPDEAAGVPFVVVRDAAAGLARAYDRRVGGVTLTFDTVRGADGRTLLADRGDGRTWSLRTGLPAGPDAAPEPLRPLPGTPFEVDAWRLQHPLGTVRRR